MIARTWKIAAALCLVVSAAGCSEDSREPSPPPPATAALTLTASDTSVIANGVNTVTLAATDGSGSGPIDLTTTRGTFPGGGTTAQIPGGTGTVILTTCDAIAVPTCAGTATVTATGPSGTRTVTITFGSLASVCPTNCSADPSCAGLACTASGGGSGTCSATTPSICTLAPACTPNPAGATTETSCSDGIDNDCSGETDCEDSSCAGDQCGALPTSVCRSGACVDLTSGLGIEIRPARSRLPADGTTTTTIAVTLTSGQDPVPNLDVTFSLSPAGLGTLSALTGTSDLNGRVFVTFTAPAIPGVAVITATVTAIPTVSASASITIPRFGSLQIPQPYALHPVMGVKTSGWNEFSPVLVQALDDQGQPYPDGLAVRFEHRTLGGSTFGPPLATTNLGACTAAARCVAYDGVVWSGAKPEDLDKTGLARAPLFSGTIAGTLQVSATATASGVTRTVTLPSVAVVGAKASLANLSVVCGPRNVPALAETTCATSLVDAPITCAALLKDRFNNLLGTSTQVMFASEAAPVGQVAWTPPYLPEAQGSEQPDLGTATQIFETLGGGLPFDVAPQAGEPSVDHALDGCGTRTHNPRDGVVTIVAVADGEEAFFDQNGSGAYEAGEPFVDQGEPFVDQDDDGVYTLGEWFLDVDGDVVYTPANGTWDAFAKIWTQTVVVYTTGGATLAAPGGTTFLGNRWVLLADWAGACSPTPTPPVFHLTATNPSVSYNVVAADRNLNFLSTGTSYAVEPVGTPEVVVLYRGLPKFADNLGFAYRYWPCDQNGVCASQCRATGAAAPCEMAPSISGFTCGYAAGVTVTRGSSPDPTVLIDWNAVTPWNRFGSAVDYIVTRSITGDSL